MATRVLGAATRIHFVGAAGAEEEDEAESEGLHFDWGFLGGIDFSLESVELAIGGAPEVVGRTERGIRERDDDTEEQEPLHDSGFCNPCAARISR